MEQDPEDQEYYNELSKRFVKTLKPLKDLRKRLDEQWTTLQLELRDEIGYGHNQNLAICLRMIQYIDLDVTCRLTDLEIFEAYKNHMEEVNQFLDLVEEKQEVKEQDKQVKLTDTIKPRSKRKQKPKKEVKQRCKVMGCTKKVTKEDCCTEHYLNECDLDENNEREKEKCSVLDCHENVIKGTYNCPKHTVENKGEQNGQKEN